MKKRIVIIAAMAMILGLSGLVYAKNSEAINDFAGKITASSQNKLDKDNTKDEETLGDENENNASENAILVQQLVEEMKEAKTNMSAKDSLADEKAAIMTAREELIKAKQAGEDTTAKETALENAIKAYKDAKAELQISVGELKKGDVQNNGVDNSDKEKHENNGHQED